MTMSRDTHRLKTLRGLARSTLDYLLLPAAAKEERRADRRLDPFDPGIDRIEAVCLDWLATAQDNSASTDGGVSRHYSLIHGWATSYPETSGYIVPTLIEAGNRRADPELLARARRVLDWLVGIQFPEGGFQGGTIGASPLVPVTFNTGQILLGLAAGTRQFGAGYSPAMHRAAWWLVDTMDADGCWRRHPSPFAAAGEKAYETHVGWGLIEAARACEAGNADAAAVYASTALRNARWAISRQHPNGWFDSCCLEEPDAPLTHTIGYVMRGLLEIFRYTRDPELLDSVVKTARAVSTRVDEKGFLAGRLNREWEGTVRWACLTGHAQIAHSLLLLARETGDRQYHKAAFALLQFVRRTVHVAGRPEVCGGVKGSFPVNGGYGTYEFLNWAPKFLIDACHEERLVRAGE
jgi:hypothetical protein